MVARRRRPVGVGFFFAMGHSSVVVVLAMVVAVAAAGVTGSGLDEWRAVGGMVSAIVAMSFLALVAHPVRPRSGDGLRGHPADVVGQHRASGADGFARDVVTVVAVWAGAVALWRFGGFDRRYGSPGSGGGDLEDMGTGRTPP